MATAHIVEYNQTSGPFLLQQRLQVDVFPRLSFLQESLQDGFCVMSLRGPQCCSCPLGDGAFASYRISVMEDRLLLCRLTAGNFSWRVEVRWAGAVWWEAASVIFIWLISCGSSLSERLPFCSCCCFYSYSFAYSWLLIYLDTLDPMCLNRKTIKLGFFSFSASSLSCSFRIYFVFFFWCISMI